MSCRLFRDLLKTRAVDYIEFNTNRMGGITQAQESAALAEAHSVPVIPTLDRCTTTKWPWLASIHQWPNISPVVGVEVANELFWYTFDGEPRAKDGFVNLDESVSCLGLTMNETTLEQYEFIE